MYINDIHPPVSKHGLSENPPFCSMTFPARNLYLEGIVQCHRWSIVHTYIIHLVMANLASWPLAAITVDLIKVDLGWIYGGCGYT